MADHSIKCKTVLIAGGAKNLGGLIARDLAQQGVNAVAIHYNSAASKADADATVAAVKAAGAQAVAIQADLTTAGAVENLFADAINAVGKPDIAINTVGKVLKKPFTEISEEFGARGISVTAVGPGPMDTPFFYPAEGADAVAYHKTAAALSPSSKTGLTDIEDVVPFIRHLVSDGWWITGQTILINGGYTTK